MKILWVVNQPIPSIAKELDIQIGFGGGWMIELSKQLSKNHHLSMVFPAQQDSTPKSGCVDNIHYYSLPCNVMSLESELKTNSIIKDIINNDTPDIVHIWGTEYLHSYLTMKVCSELNFEKNVVISIQGMVSIYCQYYYGGITDKSIYIPTIYDIRYRRSLRTQQNSFIYRGRYERLALKMAHYVIGRTDWDRAITKQINPNIEYFFCNETLRSSFYKRKWKLELCEKYSIFVSQCHSPIKGLHFALEALEIVRRNYPESHLYTTGKDPRTKKWYQISRYEKYIVSLIDKYNLNDSITFLGKLDEEQMCDQFCRSNVFVSPSVIENSSNSVGEAMILGVPLVSSDVGGVKNLLEHGKEGFLYQDNAPYMLAYYISLFFEDIELTKKISQQEQIKARCTHDKENNFKQLIDIYNKIISKK